MHMIAGVLQYVAVASFAEAWIENDIPNASAMYPKVASFAEAWIEKGIRSDIVSLRRGRLLRGGVD